MFTGNGLPRKLLFLMVHTVYADSMAIPLEWGDYLNGIALI